MPKIFETIGLDLQVLGLGNGDRLMHFFFMPDPFRCSKDNSVKFKSCNSLFLVYSPDKMKRDLNRARARGKVAEDANYRRQDSETFIYVM